MKNDMKKILVLVTTSFPYGKLEPFIESELNYYNNFDKVLCYAIHKTGEPRDITYPANFEFKHIKDYKFKRDIKYLPKLLFKKNFWSEIFTLAKSSRLSIRTIHHLVSVGLQTEHFYKHLKTEIENFDKNSEGNNKYYFYSYWMVEHALSCIGLKRHFKNSINFTRAHGYDLYEYRNKGKYIPYRKYILDNTDLVMPISEDGFRYLQEQYGQHSNIELSRLGTVDNGISQKADSEYDLTVVSCSWCVGVKRIDRIISSMAMIRDLKIKWIHIGDGNLYNTLKTLAKETLPANIDCEFIGQLTNKKILEFYRNNHIDLFINVSSSEGIPVSIMEAQSFGIPVIATNVGGVKEIITDSMNGYMLEKDFKDEELVSLIASYAQKHDDRKKGLRTTSRSMWETNYSAEKNYTELFNKIAKS